MAEDSNNIMQSWADMEEEYDNANWFRHEVSDVATNGSVNHFTNLIKSVQIPRSKPLHSNVKYQIDKINKTLSLTFNEESRENSTVLGGKGDGLVILDKYQMATFPHDFVLASISEIAPQSILPNCTPDISFLMEDGTHQVIELTTRAFSSEAIVLDACKRKLLRYSHLENIISAINVLVVSPNSADDLNGPVLDKNLSLNLNFALKLQNLFKQECGIRDLKETSLNINELKENLRIFSYPSYPEIPLLEKINYSASFNYGKGPFPESQDYVAKLKEAKSQDMSMKTVIHCPLFNVNPENGKRLPSVNPSTIYGRICYCVYQREDELIETDSYYDLEAMSEIKQGERLKVENSYDREDHLSMGLADDEKVTLGRRGLLAKRNSAIINELDPHESNHNCVSWNTDDSDIVNWLKEISQSSSGSTPAELPYAELIGKDSEVVSLWKEVSEMELMTSCRFLESVYSEISISARRRPKKEVDLSLIIRRVPNFNAYVLIHNSGDYDFDQHIFYMIIADLKNEDTKIFEKAYPIGNGWFYTEFMSTSLRRLENCQNLSKNLWSLSCLNVEQFVKSISPDTTSDDFSEIEVLSKWQLLVILSDNAQLAEVMSLSRYYYMSLVSEPKRPEKALKVLDSFPLLIRNRLVMFFIKSFLMAHETVDKIEITKTGEMFSDFYITDTTTMEEMVKKLEMCDPLVKGTLPCFLGLKVTTMDQILSLSYFHVLKNKNTDNSLSNRYKVLEKLLSNMYKYLDSGMKGKGFLDHVSYESVQSPEEMTPYTVSGPAIRSGAELFKQTVCAHNSWELKDYDLKVSEKCLEFMLKSSLEELATTKSSAENFSNRQVDLNVVGKLEDEEYEDDIAHRKRMYEQIFNLLDSMKNPVAILNIVKIKEDFEREGGVLKVHVLRKAQNTGTREFFVLTVRGRLMTKFYCDIHRALGHLHPSEKLTDPKSRDEFSSGHDRDCKKESRDKRFSGTFSTSADMTTWSQGMIMWEFEAMDRCLLPEVFHGLSHYVLEANRKKIIQLPPDILKKFLKSRHDNSELSSESVERLRDEFRSGSPAIDKQSSCIQLANDMLMGILHYPSSNYHICEMELVRKELKAKLEKLGVTLVVSFEVSSDDEGLKATILSSHKVKVMNSLKFLATAYPLIKGNIDRLFGLKTSGKKTSETTEQIMEFNSEFFALGTVVYALVKLVSRCNDHHLQDSLHKMVSSYMSQLSSVRDMGGSGYLCHFIMLSQCLSMTTMVGYTTTSWGTLEVFQDLFKDKLSYQGYIPLLSPKLAGLVDTDYINWISCLSSERARKIQATLGTFCSIDEEEFMARTTFSIRSQRKHKLLLERLGITVTQDELIDANNFEVLLRKSHSIEDSRLKITKLILNPSTVSNLTWGCRAQANSQTPYLMWAAIHRGQDDYLFSIRTLCNECQKNKDPGLDVLFPMSNQFENVMKISNLPLSIVKLNKTKRMRVKWLSPYYQQEDWCKCFRDLCRYFWFGSEAQMSHLEYQSLWSKACYAIPFLRESLEDTKLASPFESYLELYNFTLQVERKVKSRRMLVRGFVNKLVNPIMALITSNLCSSYEAEPDWKSEETKFESSILNYSSDYQRQVEKLCALSDNWVQLIASMNLKDALVISNDYKLAMIESYSKISQMYGLTTGSDLLDDNMEKIRYLVGASDLKELLINSSSTTVYFEPEECDALGRFSGDFDIIRKRKGILARVTKSGRSTVIVSQEIIDSREKGFDFMDPKTIVGDVIIPDDRNPEIVHYKGGWYMKGSISGVYVGLPRPVSSKQAMPSDKSDLLSCWVEGKPLTSEATGELYERLKPLTRKQKRKLTKSEIIKRKIARTIVKESKTRFRRFEYIPIIEKELKEKVEDESSSSSSGASFQFLKLSYNDPSFYAVMESELEKFAPADDEHADIFEFEGFVEDFEDVGTAVGETINNINWTSNNETALKIFQFYLSAKRSIHHVEVSLIASTVLRVWNESDSDSSEEEN